MRRTWLAGRGRRVHVRVRGMPGHWRDRVGRVETARGDGRWPGPPHPPFFHTGQKAARQGRSGWESLDRVRVHPSVGRMTSTYVESVWNARATAHGTGSKVRKIPRSTVMLLGLRTK